MTNTDDDAIVPDATADRDEATIKLRLTRPHPLISRTKYKNDPKNHQGHSLANDPDGVDVRVSRGQFRSALIIMDRLLKALEKQEFTIRLDTSYNSRGTYVYSGHYDKCQIYIQEEHRRVDHVLTARERAEKARYSFFSAPTWDFLPIGKLTLHPGGAVDLATEEALDDLIQRAVGEVIATIARATKERKEREAAQHKEFERQQREQEEKARSDAFYKSADALHRYRLLMEYIEEVRRFGRAPSNQLRDGQTLEEWLQWAQDKARSIHPLGH